MERARKQLPLDERDEDWERIAPPSPELRYLQERHREDFAGALKDAFLLLSSKQRNILRLRHLQGLTDERIGALYRVHQSTVTRWMAALHAELLAALDPLRGKVGRVLRPWENVCRDLAVACGKAKIPPVTPNDLRRTFASWLVQQGAPTFTVTKLMGHATEKMIHLTYGHLNAPALVAAIDLLPSWKN